MAHGHLPSSGFDKRTLHSHCDRDVCLSKLFKGRNVGSGQEPMTLSAACHFHQGLRLRIRVALPRSEGRVPTWMRLVTTPQPFPALRGGAGGGKALRGPLAGPGAELAPSAGRGQSWGPALSLASPVP